MKFYPADWRDTKLRDCSLAARGLWIDLLTYMHETEPYGHLLINGKEPSLAQIALHVARPLQEVKRALAELEAADVFSRTDNGIIFSRRMVRDKAKEIQDREHGKAGGNPNLTRGVNPHVKANGNGQDKAQWPLSSSLPSSDSSLGLKELEEEQANGKFDQFWSLYPNKIGKKAARKKFDIALKSVDFETLMGALRAYVNKTDDRPWCNPETWLNQGRWDDEPAQQQRGGALGVLDRIESQLEGASDSEAGQGSLIGLPARRFG